MVTRVRRLVRARSIVSLVLFGLIAGGLVGAAPVRAESVAALPECPDHVTVPELSEGQQAIGYTVRQGTTVEAFDAVIVDVLPDGIAPGRDLIVIDTSGELIDQAGGIWYGMSGSPIYTLDGELIGALAYGFSFGPNSYAGVTPAADMLKVAAYPEDSGAGGYSGYSTQSDVKLSRSTRTAIAQRERMSTSEIGSEMSWLKVPVSISGLSGVHRTRLRNAAIRKDLPFFIPQFAGGSASSAVLPTGAVAAGDSFAASLSYGDITLAGIGTTTYVCEGRALAFGHPFFLTGDALFGASAAHASAIIDDPVFSAYKLARVTDALGIVDQDRFAAIRGLLGREIPTMPVVQNTTALDTNETRIGAKTDVVQGATGFAAEYLPYIAWIHSFANIDSVFDQIGPGSSAISWKIEGIKTATGEPWALTRSNKWISNYDISWGSTFELLDVLYLLQFQDLEDIEFTNIDIDVSVEKALRKWQIKKVLWSRDGVTFRDVRRLRAFRGETITARALMEADDGTEKTVDMNFRVPRGRRDGTIRLSSGGSGFFGYDYYCFVYDECDGGQGSSFDALVAKLQGALRNDDLLGRSSFGSIRKRIVERQDRVVRGSDSLYVIVGSGGGGGETVPAPH